MLFIFFGVIGVLLAFGVSSSSGGNLPADEMTIPQLTNDDRVYINDYETSSCFISDDEYLSDDTLTVEILDDFAVNPANGHIMIGGVGGLDDEGNTYGFDHTLDDAFSMQDDFDSFQDIGFDDNF